MHRELGVLEDGISQDLLVPEADVGVALQHLGILANVWAASELTTPKPQNPISIELHTII